MLSGKDGAGVVVGEGIAARPARLGALTGDLRALLGTQVLGALLPTAPAELAGGILCGQDNSISRSIRRALSSRGVSGGCAFWYSSNDLRATSVPLSYAGWVTGPTW